MKNTAYFAMAAACILVFGSCTKEEVVIRDGSCPVFTATIVDYQTKTTVDADPSSATAGKVSWDLTDTITVRDNAGKTAVYQVSSINEGKAIFAYRSGDALGSGPYTATYGDAPLTDQTYSAIAGKLPMTAESETYELAFSVTCGLLKLILAKSGESIRKIEVTGTPTGGTETTYRLSCSTAQDISSARSFYIALPAGSYSKYVFLDSDGKVCTKKAKTGKSTVIEQNKIQPVTFSSSLAFEYSYADLSATGTANCYVVSEAGCYGFKAVKGNTDTSAGDIKGVRVLWESFGTDVAPSVGDLIDPDVFYADNCIIFNTNDTYSEGNAVIAAYSDAACSEGNVLWSWHIWLTDEPAGQQYNNSAGTVMDRNLGATSTVPGDVHALGLLYQWGRKDPFIGNISVTSESPYGTSAASTVEWPHPTNTDSSKGTIDYAVSHPAKFITADSTATTEFDWYYTDGSAPDNTRWQTSCKTMYDPCPAGWRVPKGGEDNIWSTAFGSSESGFSKGPWNSTYRGMDFGSGNGKGLSMQLGTAETIWYPAAGCRSYAVGGMKYPGSNGYYWTCSTNGFFACCFFFDLTGNVTFSKDDEKRATGRSVRCVPESL